MKRNVEDLVNEIHGLAGSPSKVGERKVELQWGKEDGTVAALHARLVTRGSNCLPHLHLLELPKGFCPGSRKTIWSRLKDWFEVPLSYQINWIYDSCVSSWMS